MKDKKFVKWKFIIVPGLVVITIYITVYIWRALPVITGFGSKVMCSCVFVSGRDPASVQKEELSFFPISSGKYVVNYQDSSVTGSLFGVARSRAIFRKGMGCTLIPKGSNVQEQTKSLIVHSVQPEPDSMVWPNGDKLELPTVNSYNSAEVDSALNWAFSEPYPDKPIRTRAVIVLYDGQIVAERYASGFDENTVLTGWSMAKSVTAALIGILVKQKGLNIDAPAPLLQWQNDQERKSITMQHLLQQASGIGFDENYSRLSHVTTMLYKRADMAAYAATQELEHKPGEFFNYSGGNTNILSLILRQQLGDAEYHRYPYTQLFHKIGMKTAIMERDASGTFVGSSYVFATACDWARFGLLYYRNGRWNNEQVLPEDWVKKTMEPAEASNGRYGFQFWLNRSGSGDKSSRKFPAAPEDLYYADGYEGQNIYIIPSRKLVIVRLALTQGSHFDENTFLAKLLAGFPH